MPARLSRPSALLLLAACAAPEPRAAATAAAEPATLTITATDFAFQLPDTVAAGLTRVRLVNAGQDLHHAYLVRLEPGHTVPELLEAMKGSDVLPAWASSAGGPNTPAPGEEANATVEFVPGSYAIICVIPSTDGVRHTVKGMAAGFTVVPSDAPVAATPAADATIRLVDYAFEAAPPITAGRRTIRIENGASQDHEIVIMRLAPGKHPADLLAWFGKPDGPPPVIPVGGISPVAAGGTNYVTVDLEPGQYAFYCFVPDAGDGKEHVAHGMMTEVTVM